MYHIRPIQQKDNLQIATLIRKVSQEFGLAPESGFAVADPILDDLYQVYSQKNAQYWVVVNEDDQILGGGGISPLQGDPNVLEIQKMYFDVSLRGLGFAKKILATAFEFAKLHHFQICYLETTSSLWQAVKLYEKLGFSHLKAPMGATGHSHACEIWMAKDIF
ncbi:GNAT family N-acetyltransferase [Acinetobacter cumulans]|uniref:GNAT family N-acetyltransferase n=1 Tax=Acinetobacter cumulans TaxID=2136182 RepID=A0ABX9U6R1_9GAMM|nr:GNAT family N-acetyltransferase [Acinetobacter cumulans]RLL45552.1 GNAT family N-acetyltransferase [Acinetobacter cumulans]